MLNLIIIAIAVSIDGFWGGFAFGLQKIKITVPTLLVISACTVTCTIGTMFFGNYMQSIVSPHTCKIAGAFLLSAIGLAALLNGRKKQAALSNIPPKPSYNLNDFLRIIDNPLLADLDRNNRIKYSEAIMLGLAFAMDASVAAFTFALAGFNPILIPCLFGATQFGLIGLGNLIAIAKVSDRMEGKYMLLPGAILLILGLSRLF